MSRRGDPRRGPQVPRANPNDRQGALQALQQMMQDAQNELATQTLEVSAGGGAVTVVISGQQKIQSIKISPEAVSPDDVEMLQDMILAAVNEAIEKSQEVAAQRMGSVTGGLGLPGILG